MSSSAAQSPRALEHTASLAAFLVVLTVVTVWNWRTSSISSQEKDDEDEPRVTQLDSLISASSSPLRKGGSSSSSTTTTPLPYPLPTHLERELYKEERRAKMIPRMTRKKPMYDNIIMKDPKGTVLSTISVKKAHWYVRKQLARWTDDDEKTAIQLLFQPDITRNNNNAHSSRSSASSSSLRDFNASIKQNRCVGCGADQQYAKHYVVPFSYRSLFPEHYKSHLPHDIVLLCPDCHLCAQQESQHRRNALEREQRRRRRLHPTSDQAERVDPYLHSVRSAATALRNWRQRLPPAQIEAYEQRIREWVVWEQQQQQGSQLVLDNGDNFGHSTTPPLTPQQLEAASQLESRRPNPHYVAGAILVVDSLKRRCSTKKDNDDDRSKDEFDEQALAEFVRDWRRHFVDVVRPQYLPTGWSVDAPMQSDRRRTGAEVCFTTGSNH